MPRTISNRDPLGAKPHLSWKRFISSVWAIRSAGVALSNMYPEAKSVGNWLRHGWHVALAYVVAFLVMVAVLGWHPQPLNKGAAPVPAAATAVSPAPTPAIGSPGYQ